MTKTIQKVKTKARKPASIPTPSVATPPAPVAQDKPVRRRRRKRRTKSAILAHRVITDIKQKERAFLREIGVLLSDALGFPVRVSHVRQTMAMSPDMRRASRLPKATLSRQIRDSAGFGGPPAKLHSDPLPF